MLTAPLCPVCHRPVFEPDLHEALLKRGDVDYASKEIQAAIFVPENVVLVHPGACHQAVQFGYAGLGIALWNILDYCSREAVLSWLEKMRGLLVTEKPAEMIAFLQDFCHTARGQNDRLR